MPGTVATLRFQLLPPEPDDAFWGAPCEQPLERRYQALPALVCIMCCLFGVVYCFFVVISRQRRRVQLMRIRQQEEHKEKRRKKRPLRTPARGPRAPPRPGLSDPAYRRRPVPIKRFNGDVLSPSYIQSFRDRQTGSSLSSFMASPTDTDYEYGSRGPLTACSGPPVRV